MASKDDEVLHWASRLIGERVQTEDFLNSQKPAQLITAILVQNGQNPPQTFKSLKPGNTPGSRIYNWNILSQALKKLNFELGQEQKARIVGGQISEISRLLQALFQAFGKAQKKAARIDSSIPKTQPQKPANITSYILELIQRKFELSKDQANTLISENMKFLAHLVVKGVKGQFERVVDFYSACSSDKVIAEAMGVQESVEFLLHVYKPGLLSKSEKVATLAMGLIRMAQQGGCDSSNWLTKEPVSLIGSIVLGLKRHPHLVQQFAELLPRELYDVLAAVQNVAENEEEAIEFFYRMYNYIGTRMSDKDKRLLFLRTREKVKLGKFLFTPFLIALISEGYDQEFTSQAILAKAFAKASTAVKVEATICYFAALTKTAESKSPLAGMLYKQLLRLLQTEGQNELVRQCIFSNFINLLKSSSTVPPDQLATILIRMVQPRADGEDVSTQLLILTECLTHERVRMATCMQILDCFANIYLNSKVWRQLVYRPLIDFLWRNKADETVQEELVKLLKISLALLLNHSSARGKKDIQLVAKKEAISQLINEASPLINDPDKAVLLLVHSHLEILKNVGKPYRGLTSVIQRFGDLEELVAIHKSQLEESRVEQHQKDPPKEAKRGKSIEQRSKPQPKRFLPEINRSAANIHKLPQVSQAQVQQSPKKRIVMTGADSRVLNHLKKIKLESEYKQLIVQNEKERNKQQQLAKQAKLKEEIEQRRAILGRDKDASYQPLIEFGKAIAFPLQFSPVPGELIQDRDLEAVARIWRKYHSFLKLVYQGLVRASLKSESKLDSLNLPEDLTQVHIDGMSLLPFLKDKDVPLGREEVIEICRFCNPDSKDLKCDFQGFFRVITQVAYFFTLKDTRSLSLQYTLQSLVKRICKDDNLRIQLTEEQKQLNRKLAQNPDAELPAGYVKASDSQPTFSFQFSRATNKSVYMECYQLLNEVLGKAIGSKLLIEPVIGKVSLTVAKRKKDLIAGEEERKKPLMFQKAEIKKAEMQKQERLRIKEMMEYTNKRKQQISKEMMAKRALVEQKMRKEREQRELKEMREKQARLKQEEEHRKDLDERKARLAQHKKKMEAQKKEQEEKRSQLQFEMQREADQNVKKQKQKHDRDIELVKEQVRQRELEQKRNAERERKAKEKVKKEAAMKLSKLKDRAHVQEEVKETMRQLLKESKFRTYLNSKRKFIESIFEEYLKYQKFVLHKERSMTFNSFKELTLRSRIVPELMSLVDIGAFFKVVSVMQDKVEGLSYAEFEFALLKIAFECRAKLRGELTNEEEGDKEALESLEVDVLKMGMLKFPEDTRLPKKQPKKSSRSDLVREEEPKQGGESGRQQLQQGQQQWEGQMN